MPITVSQLQEKIQSLSPEEQKELTQQLQGSIQKKFSGFAQQLAGTYETVMPSLAQYIHELIKPSISDILRKGLSFSKPAYIPPPFYPEQNSPQVISIYTVYLPVSNIIAPFIVILVKRKR